MIPSTVIGDATLYCGDAFTVLSGMPDASVDHVYTDPPYSSGGLHMAARTQRPCLKYQIDKAEGRHEDFAGDNRDQRSFLAWFALWASQAYRVMRPGGICAVFADWRQLPVTTDGLQAAGFVWRGVIPWDKTEACRPEKGRYRNQCEYVVWGSRDALPRATPDAPCLPGVYRHRVRPAEKRHMAGKPLALMTDLLSITRPGETILDPFMGSATTGMAALQGGRRFVGVEMAPAIFRGAVDRLSSCAASEAR